jgi:hypothetical protein
MAEQIPAARLFQEIVHRVSGENASQKYSQPDKAFNKTRSITAFTILVKVYLYKSCFDYAAE